MKIGILTCIKSNDVCARVGCLKAFNSRTYFFSEYDENTELGAMMTCNACRENNEMEPEEDPGILEKIDRLISEDIKVMHCGVCRMHEGVECRRIAKICAMIEEKGIKVVRGTHKE